MKSIPRAVLSLVAVMTPFAGTAAERVETSYVPYRFDPGESWTTKAEGDPGETKLDGKTWTLDFSKGAKWISLVPPDTALLGDVGRLRLKVRGAAGGHSVHLYLNTHFMTFHKKAGEFSGAGEQELVIDAPPGPGWQWFGGENDGKLHGPLRLGEIRLEANGHAGKSALELISISVEGSMPPDKRCVATARAIEDGGPARFAATVRCLSGAPLKGAVSWRLRDWAGNEIGAGERPVTAPPQAGRAVAEVPLPAAAGGLKFVEAEFTAAFAGQQIPGADACWLGRQPPHKDTALRPDSPFGMGVYLGRYEGEDMERTARAACEAGVKWSREDFEWERIEKEPGRFDWSFHDNLVAVAKRNGITVYAIVGYWTPWSKAYTEEGVDQYVRYLRELVRRYQKDIRHWEIWNEPNIFFWDGPKDLYATLLKKSFQAIKEIDPSLAVLGISTAGIDYNFIARMLARETPFDVLTIHPYRPVLEDRIFINELKIASDLVRLPGGKRRPIWLTEMGWSTYTPHNTRSQPFAPTPLRVQAELIARTYLCSIVSGVEPRTFWYNFRNDGEEPLYFEHEMGILYRDFQPKPAYYAFATLARVLQDKVPAGAVDAGDGVLAHRFDPRPGTRGRVFALWHPSADATASLRLPARTATVVNTIGETRDVETGAGGMLRLRLRKGAPVYVLVE